MTISYHLHFLRISKVSNMLYFLRISKVSNMLHHGLVGRVHSKESYFIFTYTFLAFLLLLFIKKFVFLSFHFFFR